MPDKEHQWAQPPTDCDLIITIHIRNGMDTPAEVLNAIEEALDGYAGYGIRLDVPFMQQPGHPSGQIFDALGWQAGDWKITGLVR